jgi:hypothetical protein
MSSIIISKPLNNIPITAEIRAKQVERNLKGNDKAEKGMRIVAQAQKAESGFSKRQVKFIEQAVTSKEFYKGSMDPKEMAARLHSLVRQRIEKAIEIDKCCPKGLKGITLENFEKLTKCTAPYQVKPLETTKVSKTEAETFIAQYEKGEEIPRYVATFDITGEHTLNVKKYIDVRVSYTIQKTIKNLQEKGKNVEVFIGSSKAMKKYYAAKGYQPVAQLETNNSNKYLVFASEDQSQHKLVIAGISNQSRYNNVLMQLKFMGADLGKVSVHGSLSSAMAENVMELRKNLKLSTKGTQPTLAFIGNRSIVFIELAKYLYPGVITPQQTEEEQEKEAEKLLEKNGFTTVDIDKVFKYSSAKINIKGQTSSIVAFRMPNGSLSGLATKEILDSGFKDLIMVGAGGSLDEDHGGGLGSMQVVQSSSYQDKPLSLSQSQIMPVAEMHILGADVRTGCSNVTVDGPLEENTVWHTHAKEQGRTSVDVETYHIFDAISRCHREDVRVLPGLFNSDVVGKHPLEDKITANNAYSKFPEILKGVFTYEGIVKEQQIPTKTLKA